MNEATKSKLRERLGEMGMNSPAMDVALGDAVAVPATGDHLVRDGVVHPVIEVERMGEDDECVSWTVYTEPEE